MDGRRTVVVAGLATAALLLPACSGSDKKGVQAAAGGVAGEAASSTTVLESTTSTTAPSTTTTTAPKPTTTTQPPLLGTPGAVPQLTRVLSAGARGDDVKAVEQRLTDLKFDPGPVDGRFDAMTAQAVMSFQKQTGLPRSSRVDGATQARMNSAGLGTPMVPDGEAERVEVDISRQVLQIWKGGQLVRVLGVSTGTNKRYCDTTESGKRVCGVANTPTGKFRFERRIPGQRRSELGVLYDPVYFVGGWAVHGSPSVPATPASHGCVRIPMWESKWFQANVPLGTQMVLIKGGAPPVPTLTPAPPPTTAPPTTATTAAPTTATTRPATSTTRPATTTTKAPATTTTTRPPVTPAP